MKHNKKVALKLTIDKQAHLTGHNASIYALAPFSTSNTFLSAAGDGWIVKWDLDDPEMGRLLAKVETQVFSLAYLHEYELVIAGNMNGGVHWINTQNLSDAKNVAHHSKGVFGIQQVGKYIFTIGGGGLLTKWSIDGMRTLESLHLSNRSLRSICYVPE
ncbi:MAG: hypothetical protein AAFO07_14635 [Bacteroidota bacterium]